MVRQSVEAVFLNCDESMRGRSEVISIGANMHENLGRDNNKGLE